MLPELAPVSPRRVLIIVVLPAPLGPRKPKALPRGTSRSTLSIAVREPKRLVSPCVSMAGSSAPPDCGTLVGEDI